MRKIIIIVLALAVVLGFLFWKFAPNVFNRKPPASENQPITLNISALWEDENFVKSAIDEYVKTHPNITINYKNQSSVNYRSRIQAQLDQPEEKIDIFLIHNTWVPMFLKANQLSPIPGDIISLDEYQKDFYPIINQSFVKDKNIYALPRGIDGLALFYNEDILKAVGEKVPKTWDEFQVSAQKLTVKDQDGNIKTAGAALGTTNNVDHWSDIVGLLFFQNPGADISKPTNERSAEVLEFYTSFVKDKDASTWDKTFDKSTQMFAQNKLAYYFAPSWREQELREQNSQLNFKIAPVPQVSSEDHISWASFWAYAVSAKSPSQRQAWEFLKFFTSKDTQKQLYNLAISKRPVGLPYSRTEMQNELINDEWASAFVSQAPNYKSWYLSSNTFDQGINDRIIKYYEDAVNSAVEGGDAQALLDTTAKGIEEVLGDFKDYLLLK